MNAATLAAVAVTANLANSESGQAVSNGPAIFLVIGLFAIIGFYFYTLIRPSAWDGVEKWLTDEQTKDYIRSQIKRGEEAWDHNQYADLEYRRNEYGHWEVKQYPCMCGSSNPGPLENYTPPEPYWTHASPYQQMTIAQLEINKNV